MVNIITGGELSLPLIQFLLYNKVRVSVFVDADIQDSSIATLLHFCNYANIPITRGHTEEVYDWLKSSGAKATFIMGYGHLLDTTRINENHLLYCYNIHFSTLPAYKGANPVFWQIKNGAEELGITIHRINQKFDDGPIFWQKKIKREQHFSFGFANNVLSNVSIEGVSYILNSISTQKIMPVIKHDNTPKSYYPKPGLNEVLIDWRNMEPQQVTNLISACNPWNKGAITMLNEREVKILDGIIKQHSSSNQQFPGTILNTSDTLEVQCSNNKVLQVNMLNIDGTFVPARDAVYFGLQKGQCFTSNMPANAG